FTAKLGNRRSSLQNRLRRERAEAADDLRLDHGELLFEEGIARHYLVGFGIAIIRRSTFQDIADVNVVALDVDRFDDLRQQLPGPAHKRQTLLIFIEARGFADEHEFRVGIAGAENNIRPFWSKLAALAVADFVADSLKSGSVVC